MGYQVGSACFTQKADAANAQRWTLGHGSSIVVNGQPHLVQYDVAQPDALLYRLVRTTDGAVTAEMAVPFEPPECQVLGVQDGLQMGWLVGSALIGAFCVMFIARALRGETGESYGAG